MGRYRHAGPVNASHPGGAGGRETIGEGLRVKDRDKRQIGPLGKALKDLGFRLLATRGTAAALEAAGIEAESVFKVNEGRPNIVDLVKTRKIDLIMCARSSNG